MDKLLINFKNKIQRSVTVKHYCRENELFKYEFNSGTKHSISIREIESVVVLPTPPKER